MFPEICMVGAKVIQFSAQYFGACFELLTKCGWINISIYVHLGAPYRATGHEIAPNTAANATKIIVLATKIQKLVAKLATRTL